MEDALAPPRVRRSLAIERATLVPMHGEVLRDHTVVVEAGRIVWVGPSHTARVPADALAIDGRGLHVLPGLADMHIHVIEEIDLLLCLRFGVTTVRNLYGMPRHLRWRERIARGQMLGPTIHTAGPIVDGRPTMRAGVVTVATVQEAREAVARVKRLGYEAVKVSDHLPPDMYEAIVDVARRESVDVVGHVPFRVGIDGALRARQRSIEHSYGYIEGMHPLGSPLREGRVDPETARQLLADAVTAPDDDRIEELAAATRDAGTWNCPTMMIRRRHLQRLEDLEARDEMRYVSALARERWREFKRTYPYDLAHKASELEIQHRLLRRLHALGAGLLVGTDAPVHHIVHGASLHEELAEFVAAGLSPLAALTLATRGAASFFGEADEWGSISAGMRADLLLLDADPLRDIANTTRIAGVVVRGSFMDRAELERRLALATAARDTRVTGALAEPLGGHPARQTFVFEVRWGRHALGRERVTLSEDRRERIVASDSEIESFSGPGLLAGEAGRYRAELRSDERGVMRAAALWSDTIDGEARCSIERVDGAVRLARDDPMERGEAQMSGIADDVVLGRAHMAFYVSIGPRLARLGVGERCAISLVGPGSPPDYDVMSTEFAIERLADAPDGRRFAFTATRPNRVLVGSLAYDAQGVPLGIEFGVRPSELTQGLVRTPSRTSPPVEVRRVQAL
jgi:hypothetical protein